MEPYLSKIDAKITEPLLIRPTTTMSRYTRVMRSASMVLLSHMFVRFSPANVDTTLQLMAVVLVVFFSNIVVTFVLISRK